MAVRNRRWNHALFPIDEHLIERLIEEHHAHEDEETDDDPAADFFELDDGDTDSDSSSLWTVVESSAEEQADDDLDSPAFDAEAADDEHAVNMRVLDDYLRRRLIDEPEPIAPTLH